MNNDNAKAQLTNVQVMRRMVGLTRPLAPFMALAIISGVAGFTCATALPVLAAETALVLVGRGSLAISMGVAVGILFALAVARGVLHYIEQRCNHYIAFRLLAHIRSLIFGALRRLAPAKLSGRDKGSLISTITSDVELLEVFYAHTISPIAIAVLMAVVMMAFLGGIHPATALLALVFYLLVGVVVPLRVSRASEELGLRSRELAGSLSSYVLEGLRGLLQVEQYDQGANRLRGLDERSRELVECQGRLRDKGTAGQVASSVLIAVSTFCQLALVAWLAGSGAISAEGAVLAMVATISSFGPFIALSNLGSTLQSTLGSARRVLAILDEDPQVVEVEDGVVPEGFSGISADDVVFSYGGERVLDDVSIGVCPGEIVGIVGRSGSGKSTLCRLFMRFWDVDEGCVRLSGEDVRTVAVSALRDNEAFVEQDTQLFHDSIRDNLLIARPNATNAEIEAACRAASVHDFIMSLPRGYDTMVGELGDTLSGGERQRLGLARAFLHDAPLLILDEPTSNLDSLNEGQVLRALDEQRGKRAVVLVSHRPSTIAVADRSYSMESGRVS